MENVTVVRETIRGDRVFKEMSDGTIKVSPLHRIPGTQYGTYATISGFPTDEKIARAKELVVDDVCRIIREVANERDDFFIIKELDGITSVGHKFFLPTVDRDDDFSRFKELIVE